MNKEPYPVVIFHVGLEMEIVYSEMLTLWLTTYRSEVYQDEKVTLMTKRFGVVIVKIKKIHQ